jgi:hypothetical protein
VARTIDTKGVAAGHVVLHGVHSNTEYWAVPRHLVGQGHDGGEFGGMSRCCVGDCLSRGLSGCRKEGVAASGRANMRGLYVLYLCGLQEARQVADGQFVVSVQPRWGRLLFGRALDVIGRGSYRIHGAYAQQGARADMS